MDSLWVNYGVFLDRAAVPHPRESQRWKDGSGLEACVAQSSPDPD
ncbi:MAG TPA: hypothetical protein VL793_14725 [Patescibacteria group bacterium]|nr:hypothetical protein [Patescibacteria group bacterium]